ncbi:MAG TPA: hypothetical protein VEL76_23470, partial [Gemmataceae bacterium]|nr:hypothetical protein [Gemmataceae bacterium]
MQNESIPDPVGLEVLVGNWFAWFGYARGRGMMQLHLNDDGTFRFADFGRGEQSSGTYTVVRGELVLGNASKGTGRRWRILSIRP